MSVYNLQNNNFVALNETSGILQNMTSSNVEYVVCADGDTPTIDTGIRISPSKKLKFSQTLGTSYVRVTGNATGDVIVTPNDAMTGGGGGGSTIIYNHVKEWQPNIPYTKGTLVIYNNKLYKCEVPNNKAIFDVNDWVEIGGSGGTNISIWAEDTTYAPNDIVLHNNTLYVCVEGHTSSSDFDDDSSYWMVITDSTGTILPDWQPREKYEKDEIVNVGGFIYRCKNPHVSKLTFATMGGVTGDEVDWELISWVDWNTSTQYLAGQIVYHDGAMWRCLENHVSDSTSIENDMVKDHEKWIKIGGSEIDNTITQWVASTEYKKGQYVTYNNNLYECKEDNDDATFDADKWQLIGGSSDDVSITDWEADTEYAVGDLVIYNNVLYQCITANDDATFNSEKWTSIGALDADLKEWKANTLYKVGNFVVKNNKLYKCITANKDATFDPSKWTEIGDMSDIQAWESGTSYAVDDYVIYDNRVYQCDTANDDTIFDPAKWTDIGAIQSIVEEWQSGKDYAVGALVIKDKVIYKCTTANDDTIFTPSKWEVQIDNTKAVTVWTSGSTYAVGDYVVYQGVIYKCKTANSDTTFTASKWEKVDEPTGFIIGDWKTATAYKANQLVRYDDDVYMCLEGHTSDVFRTDYNNELWLKVDHAVPHYKKGKFYAKDSIVCYGKQLYHCLISHISSGDSPLDATGYSNTWGKGTSYPIIQYGDMTAIYSGTQNMVVDIGAETSAKTIDVTFTNKKIHITDFEVFVSSDGTDYTSVYTGTNNASATNTVNIDVTGLSFRYVKIESTGCTYVSGADRYSWVSGISVVGDNTDKWEVYKSGGSEAGVVTWESNKEYKANTLTVQNGSLYVCTTDHTSGSTFLADLLAGKWEYLGKEGANNITQTTLYSGSDKVSTSSSYTISETLTSTSYDYLVAQITAFNSNNNFVSSYTMIMKWETNRTTPAYYNSFYSSDASNYEYGGVVIATGTTLTFVPNIVGSNVAKLCLSSVTGIKFNTLTTEDIANMAMPSDVYITLESNTSSVDKLYTAPADGYIFAQSDGWVQVWNEYRVSDSTSLWGAFSGYSNASSGVGRVFVPVRKGVTISYYGRATTTAKFIYSIGSAKALGLI